jgi:hypothetical protein
MGAITDFINDYLKTRYATGLDISKDEQPDLKYASGLDIPKNGSPQGSGAAPNGNGPLGLGASVGRGGKNIPDDVTRVQAALNRRVNAGLPENGKFDAKTQQAIEEFQIRLGQFKPSGLIEPGRGVARALASSAKLAPAAEPPKPMQPPKLGDPSLATAATVWRGTRELLATNIGELKKGVLGHYGNDNPTLLKAIEAELQNLGGILDKLDHRLADSLESANAKPDAAARREELKNAKSILTGYIEYVKSEPMIAHIDANPFGVDTQLKAALMDSLTHLAKSIK